MSTFNNYYLVIRGVNFFIGFVSFVFLLTDRDDKCCEGVSSDYSPVVHDILRCDFTILPVIINNSSIKIIHLHIIKMAFLFIIIVF